MLLWQRITVSTGANVGEPGELPAHLIGLAEGTLASLPAAFGLATLAQLELEDAGFLPVELPTPPPAVPQVVTRGRAKVALLTAGKLDAVEAFIADADRETQIFWADEPEFHRDSPHLLAVASALGLTDAEVDDLFRAAAAL